MFKDKTIRFEVIELHRLYSLENKIKGGQQTNEIIELWGVDVKEYFCFHFRNAMPELLPYKFDLKKNPYESNQGRMEANVSHLF